MALVQVGFKLSKRLGHVFAAVAKANVAGLVVDGAGKKQYASVTDDVFAEGEDILLRLETSEADSAGVGRGPIEKIGVAREECAEQREIVVDDLEVAVDEFLAMTEGERGEKFAGCAGADGGVVLERDDLLQEGFVMRGEPGEAQAGQAVGLADGT